MPLFKLENNKTIKIEKKNVNEREIQRLVESNLIEILGINFLATEFVTTEGRIDTLGIDQNGAPVIIEYKRTQNDAVINQATWYLEWLLDHKETFEKLVEKELSNKHDSPMVSYDGEQITPKAFIDWGNPRVICIAESYNKFDLGLVKFLPFSIELLKYRLYDDLFSIEGENTQKGLKLTKRSVVDTEEKTVREYGKEHFVGELFKGNWIESIELYEQLKEKIFELDSNIEEKINKRWISYKIENIFCEVIPQAKGLWIHITIPVKKIKENKLELHDVSQKGHWGTGETKFRIEKINEIDSALDYIKQSYEHSL